MSKFLIGLGECSKYYLYILGTVIFKCLRDCMFGFNNINPESKIGLFGFIPKLSNHHLIQSLYRYFSFILGGVLFTYILKKLSDEENNKKKDKQKLVLKVSLIQDQKYADFGKIKITDILIVCLIYSIHSELSRIMYLFDFGSLDLWTIDIMFILLFMDIYFVVNFYKHQKCSMIFIIIIDTILLLISSLLPYTDHEDIEESTAKDYNAYNNIEDITGNNYAFIVVLLIFIILSGLLSYARVKEKVLIDFYYLSPYKLIFYIGIFGFIITSIILGITTIFNCSEETDYIKEHCYVIRIENNISKYYYDNIVAYFDELKENKSSYAFLLEILLITPLFLIISFLEFTCEILTISYFNPNYILVRDSIYYGISRLIFFLYNLNKNYKQYLTLTQFFILELSEIIAILGYAVYLEIIELRFLGLDENLKRNIIKRGTLEAIKPFYDNDDKEIFDESFGDEEQNNNNEKENHDEF